MVPPNADNAPQPRPRVKTVQETVCADRGIDFTCEIQLLPMARNKWPVLSCYERKLPASAISALGSDKLGQSPLGEDVSFSPASIGAEPTRA
jgi:hypothetical protein